MDIKPIKTETDYEAVLEEIERLMDAEPDTQEGDRLDVLTTRLGRKSVTGSQSRKHFS